MGNKVLALILTKGAGNQLQNLTKKHVDETVSFAAKYRLIDFVISNCANSGIDSLCFLTPKESKTIQDYVGNGSRWDMNDVSYFSLSNEHKQNDVSLLDVVKDNLEAIESKKPDYVLLLSANHVYRTTYNDLIAYHIENKADCTALVIEVEKKDASKYNILVTDSKGNITKYEEKPKKPRGTSVCTGVYCFSWPALKEYLKQGSNIESDILPLMIKDKKKLLTYKFYGYFREINTFNSFHTVSVDIVLNRWNNNLFNLDDRTRIYAENSCSFPQYIAEGALVTNSVVEEGATVFGDCDACVISRNVLIEEGAKVDHTVVMANAVIKKGAVVHNAVIAEGAIVEENAKINTDSNGIVLVN